MSSIDDRQYWICRLCHLNSRRPRSVKAFASICTGAISTAIDHLKRVHRVGPHGLITVDKDQPSTASHQSTIDSYCNVAVERNRAAAAFDSEVLKGILTRYAFQSNQLYLR